MGQYADLFARIVDAEQDMPELMAGEAGTLDQVKKLVNDMNGSHYQVEIDHSDLLMPTYLRVSDAKGDFAIIPFEIVPGNPAPELSLSVSWGNGRAQFDLASETGCRRAAETIAQEALGQLHNATRAKAIIRHFIQD